MAVTNSEVQWSADLRLHRCPSTELVGSAEERGAHWSSVGYNTPLHCWAPAVPSVVRAGEPACGSCCQDSPDLFVHRLMCRSWGERLKTPSRTSDLFFAFVLVPKQIQCWRKLSAASAGAMCLLELQLLWEDPVALGLLPDWTCSQILFLMRFPALVR